MTRAHMAPLGGTLAGDRCVVGAAYRAARETADATLSDAGTSAGVDRSFISQIENGRVNVSLDVLARLAAGIGHRLTLEVAGHAATITPGTPVARSVTLDAVSHITRALSCATYVTLDG